MIHDCWSSFSIGNLEEAENFYKQVLGLSVKRMDMGILELLPPGGTKVWLYPKKDHRPATYTVFNLLVNNIDKEVDRFKSLGIEFDRYEGFETDEKGIVRSAGGPPIAWFKDPSGNIIALIESAATA